LRNIDGIRLGRIPVRAYSRVQHDITLVLIPSLALNAFGPNLVRQLVMDKNPRIVRVRRYPDKPPDAGKPVIMVRLFCARVAVGLAGAMHHAIADTPCLHRVGIPFHAKRPAIEIFAIKKLNGSVL
jgi:hypothetical protein